MEIEVSKEGGRIGLFGKKGGVGSWLVRIGVVEVEEGDEGKFSLVVNR